MAQRPVWRGHLRLALVSCPVALYSARQDRGTIRFHLINPDTGHRIRMITQDAETGDEVSRSDLVKGYEFRKNTYVLLTDEDFDSVRVESASVMAIDKFVDATAIDPMYYDTSYYLAPDGDAGRDVYAVLLKALTESRRVGLSRVVIARRERTVALRPSQGGLLAHTLYEQRDIQDAGPLFNDVARVQTDPSMVDLARQLIDRQVERYNPAADLEDRYEARLRALIDAKLKGAGVEDEEEAPPPDQNNVVDLMAALKKSLGQAADPPASRKPANKNSRKPADKKKAEPKKTSARRPAAATPSRPARKRA
ncbi:MAG: Ku protein [Acetobacteraceae bacterium]|nr:Ku protein [Pseudomonadota bacterium]